MMKNEKIKAYLKSSKEEQEKAFKAFAKKETIFEEIYAELKEFNFEEYKLKLEKEIQDNLKEWWVNPEKGIVKEEELFAILFEYNNFYEEEVDADSYGIGQWADFKVETEEFDMGNGYDFTTEFYAAPGLTLDFFGPLQKLDYSNLPEKYEEKEIDDFDGFYELTQLFKFSGMLSICEVFQKMELNKEFEALNYKNNFMFIIDEHDSSEVYPLLVKEKK